VSVAIFLAILYTGSVAAWEWPGIPSSDGLLSDSPGLSFVVSDDGMTAIHAGRILLITDEVLIIDHGNELWSRYQFPRSSKIRRHLQRSPVEVDAGSRLVPSSLLAGQTFYLSIWDRRSNEWLDPRQILPVRDFRISKVQVMGIQRNIPLSVQELSEGPVDFVVSADISRLLTPYEVALLVNGSTVGRVRFGNIVAGNVREYRGENYLMLGPAVLRAGENLIEIVVFDYNGSRFAHETTLQTVPGE